VNPVAHLEALDEKGVSAGAKEVTGQPPGMGLEGSYTLLSKIMGQPDRSTISKIITHSNR
jgi:hypothetical protein